MSGILVVIIGMHIVLKRHLFSIAASVSHSFLRSSCVRECAIMRRSTP